MTETELPRGPLASASCSNGSGTLSGSALSGIRVDADATVTCTFTDTPVPPRGTLVIRKVTDPTPDPTGMGFGFTTNSQTPQPPDASSLPDVVTLENGETQSYTLRPGTDYTVTETRRRRGC